MLKSKIISIVLFAFWATAALADEAKDAAAAKTSSAKAQSTAKTAADSPRVTRADRLDLDTTVVTGNRELPKVLYIVPWKKAELGELPAQPFNTLLDEMLQPVDRDVFKREVKYFHAVASGVDATAHANGAEGAKTP